MASNLKKNYVTRESIIVLKSIYDSPKNTSGNEVLEVHNGFRNYLVNYK